MPVAVIGAAFGDEGKGLVTDALAERGDYDLVVRYNGGAQAGHTVTHGKFNAAGKEHIIRHVFHHYGSGTLRGVQTYLGRRFVVNPILFMRERRELITLTDALQAVWPDRYRQASNAAQALFCDPRCQITTPYDMLINEMIEHKRGADRHGSCGVGFGETIERGEHANGFFGIRVNGISEGEKFLDQALRQILKDWVPYRMEKLGLKPEDDPLRWEYMNSKVIRERWIDDTVMMKKFMAESHPAGVLSPDTIFEGAQGLLLDEKSKFFPHVTRSRTGGVYIKEMLDEYADTHKSKMECYPIYVLRSYMTRHGAGPFPSEKDLGYYYRNDETNVHNDWQGTIRQGELDLPLIIDALDEDTDNFMGAASHELFMTWMDHPVVNNDPEPYIDRVSSALGLDPTGWSTGPSHDDIDWY